MANYLLHGTVHVNIQEAAGLVDEDRKTGAAPGYFRSLIENIEETTGLGRGRSRLYATVDFGKQRVGRTAIVENQPSHVVWNEKFRIYAAHTASDLIITVKDDNSIGATLIGRARISFSELLSENLIEGWYDLCKENGQPVRGGQSKVRVKMQFYSAQNDPNWGRGINDRAYAGVPYTYFPQRKGCKVTLYQDAHMPDNFLPPIYLAEGQQKEPTRCWEDVYHAIVEAQHFIYITGWSVYTEIRLIRDEERMIEGADGLTLGELLKRKADEGVRVNLLVWDDRTSGGFLSRDGLMATHDEETMIYFQGTSVNCELCPRNPDSGLSYIQGFEIGAMFTHHQKTIIMDAPAGRRQRRVVSFVGGIDLCDGRFDTQYHPLFHSLSNANHDDFHQPNFAGTSIECGGPREPWHDIHSKLEGVVAWDVLFNFEIRWRRQMKSKEDLLLQITELEDMVTPEPVVDEDDDQSWNVQMFRSIDGGAVVFRSIDGGAVEFPTKPEVAASMGLVSGKDNTIDRSIQDAYVNAIRRAKNYIYIENQYFLGSCFAWDDKKDCNASNLIPIELTLKIVSKIEAHEPFAVYIITPMWPEGAPESGSVQAILDWQNRTMNMMYREVATALHAQGNHGSPKDYLNFYCLGNREAYHDGEFAPPSQPEAGSCYGEAQKNRRFMIYVHAKMMIVDDEYIIIGSANINERSMSGSRDTEIAMGAWQPNHIYEEGYPRGQIHGFRMSLWYEHLGRLDNAFLHPERPACAQLWNDVADDMWTLYTQEEPVDMPAHVLPFPVAVAPDGQVSSYPNILNFPDTKGKIVGLYSDTLPAILTT